MAGSPRSIDGLSFDEVKAGFVELQEAFADLERENEALREKHADLKREYDALREEIARLKGLKGRPKLKPSGMHQETQARAKAKSGDKKRRRGPKNSNLVIDEDKVLEAEGVPDGSRFKGTEDYVVQDLIIESHVIRFRRQRWLTPEGQTIVAPLPAGTVGHFGAQLRRFVLMQYHQGQMTIPRLVELLHAVGIDISKRQVVRILTERKQDILAEARDVLRAGLQSAAWISVDDTGARHRGRNGVCTQIGNDHFTAFVTTFSKSRLNFLEILRAGHRNYVVNDEALAYMRRRKLAGPLIDRLAAHESKRFCDEEAWRAHLVRLGIAERNVKADPVTIATEGALWGSVVDHGFLRDAVILSDDAGQFNVGYHALCWIHAERLIHKLIGFNDLHRKAIERAKSRVWRLYGDLQDYCHDPTPRFAAALRRRFDRIFTSRSKFATLDRLLDRLHANKAELLVALERPDVPLHTNGTENDIRCQATRRKISGGTRSDLGRDNRDALLGLKKTSAKHSINFWDYLGDRLAVPGAPKVPPLPDLVRQAAKA